jgi:hypothetical protein
LDAAGAVVMTDALMNHILRWRAVKPNHPRRSYYTRRLRSAKHAKASRGEGSSAYW